MSKRQAEDADKLRSNEIFETKKNHNITNQKVKDQNLVNYLEVMMGLQAKINPELKTHLMICNKKPL